MKKLSTEDIGKPCGIKGIQLIRCDGTNMPLSIIHPFVIVGFDGEGTKQEALVMLGGNLNVYSVKKDMLIF